MFARTIARRCFMPSAVHGMGVQAARHAHTVYHADRIADLKTSVFSHFTLLNNKHNGCNLGQGFPSAPAPAFVKEAACNAIQKNVNQYARSAGLPTLIEVLASTYSEQLGHAVKPLSEVCVTSGATQALFSAAMALVNPGDEVIMMEPIYDSYEADIRVAGGVPRFVRMNHEGGQWHYPMKELDEAFSARTKLVFLNTPHNPTGKVFARAELEHVADMAKRHDAIVVADEVYERLIYTDTHSPHVSIASLPGMWDRTVTISSIGKTFGVTGWKVGWAIGPEHLLSGIQSIQQYIPFCVTTPMQQAAADIMSHPGLDEYLAGFRESYETRRNHMFDIIQNDAKLPAVMPDGSFFILADIEGVAGPNETDFQFCERLVAEAGVTTIPMSSLCGTTEVHPSPRSIRFAFCQELDTILEAGKRLKKWKATI